MWLMHQQGHFKLLLALAALGKTRCLTASGLCHRDPVWEPAAARITKDSKDRAKTLEQVGQVITGPELTVAQGWLRTK